MGLLLLLSTPAFAQSGPSPSFDPDDQAGAGDGFDSVNPYNGQLAVTVPIGPVYQVGPGLAFQIRLHYSSRIWEPGLWQNFPPVEPNMLLRGDRALGVGWRFSIGQIVESSNGVPAAYIGPSGSAHRLYNRRFFSGSPDPTFFYTRDGSYLRVRYLGVTTGYEMWTSAGTKTTFGKKVINYDDPPSTYINDYGRGRNGWHATRIENPYLDAINVTYQASYPWVPQTITIPSIGGAGDRVLSILMSGDRIASFTVPTADGDATYTLIHSTGGSLQRPIPHPSTYATSPRYLSQVGLPNVGYTSSYSFTYHDNSSSDSAFGRGAMRTQTIPTGATFTYDYGTWTWYHANPLNRPSNCGYPMAPYPTGRPILKTGPGLEPSNLPHVSDCAASDRAAGVVQRTVAYTTHNGNATSVTKWYQWDYPQGESTTGPSAETQTLVLSPTNVDGNQHSTTYLFAASTAGAVAGPLVGALLRVAVFDGNQSAGNGPSTSIAVRVQRMAYETDAYDTSMSITPASEAFDANRRLLSNVTIYNGISPSQPTPTGKFHQLDYEYDANAGQHSKETHSGNVGNDARVLETTWTPVISSTDWRLEVPQELRLKASIAAPPFSTVTSTFDGNGFVTSTTATDGSPANAGTYRHDTPRDAHGFPYSETVVHGTSSYTRSLTFSAGSLKTARWSGFSWDVVNNGIDSDTGLVTSATDPNGLVTTFTHDKLGRTRTMSRPGGDASTTADYESPTATVVTTDKSGTEYAWEQMISDSLGRPVKTRRQMPAAEKSKKIIRYDGQGNTIEESEWLADAASETSPAGSELTNFDSFGRPRTITTADGKSTSIDYSDGSAHPASIWRGAVTINDLGGSASTTVYLSDAFGNLTTVTEPTIGDTTYSYNPQDRLIGVAQGVQTRTYTWDAFGLLRKEKAPERQNLEVTYSSYDALGSLLAESHPGSTSTHRTFSYDGAGRLREAFASSQRFLLNEYDGSGGCIGECPDPGLHPKGQLTRRTGENPISSPPLTITEEFTYSDPAGRLSKKKTKITPGTFSPMTESWVYDPVGSIVHYAHPRSAGLFAVSTSYDHGLPTAVRANGLPVVLDTAYHPSGLMKTYSTGNGTGPQVLTHVDQDVSSMARPSKIWTSGASANFDTGTFAYDGAGNIRTMGSDQFVYDRLSRLTSATLYNAQNQPLGAQAFNYDRYGNLTSTTGVNPRNFPVLAASNRLSGSTYDNRGNLLTINNGNGNEIYTYDGLDRMLTYQQSTNIWKYAYAGGGERVVKTSPSGTEAYYILRDEKSGVATELQNTVVSRDNIYLGGLLVATYQSCTANGVPGWQYYSSDHLGTPRLVTDAAGATLDLRKYWPYGDEAQATLPTSPQRIRFAGMERETNESGNRYYAHARSFDFQAAGRFLSVDLLGGSPGNPQSLNRYSYVIGNPINLVDPFGLEPVNAGSSYTGFNPNTGESISGRFTLFSGDPRDFGRVFSGVPGDPSLYQYGAYWDLDAVPAGDVRTVARWELPMEYWQELLFGAVVRGVVLAGPAVELAAYATAAYAGLVGVGLAAWPGGAVSLSMLRAASPAGAAQLVRLIGPGERIADLLNEGKVRTFTTGVEHALVKLANGQRALMSGAADRISFRAGEITFLYAHTHAYQFLQGGASASDQAALARLGQWASYVLERGQLIKYYAGR